MLIAVVAGSIGIGIGVGVGVGGCATKRGGGGSESSSDGSAARAGRVRVERTTYRTWPHAVHMTNGEAELVIVPAIGGRVMRYALVERGGDGEPVETGNVLWEDPTLAGQRGLVDDATGDWPNFGGEKVWPWPQDGWPAVLGREWPPPRAVDQAPYAWKILDDGAVRLESPVIPEYGLVARRTIRLADRGTRVTIVSEFVPAPDTRAPPTRDPIPPGSKLTPAQAATRASKPIPAATWAILQLPASEIMVARMLPGVEALGGGRGSKSLPADARWDRADPIVRGVVRLERSRTAGRKIGLDAELLAALTPDRRRLLVVRSPTAADAKAAGYEPAERAQVYTEPDPPADAARGRAPYAEFEFTGPRAPVAPDGCSPPLTVTWELHALPGPLSDERAVADFVSGP